MTESSVLQQVDVKRKISVWTPVQYFDVVEKITKFCGNKCKFTFKVSDEYMVRTILYYNTKISSIKIEPQFVQGTNKVFRLRVSCFLHVHFLTPGNASDSRIEEVSTSVLKEFEESIRTVMFYELNPDTDSWRFKRVVFP
jgi:hypothetical protein